MNRPSAPLAATGLVLAVLALLALARGPAEGPPVAARVSSSPEPAEDASEQGRRLLSEEPIDVNSATAEELELLPRIGPTLAARVIAEREAAGPFDSVEGLLRVRGIGPRTLERLRPLITAPIANVPSPLAP